MVDPKQESLVFSPPMLDLSGWAQQGDFNRLRFGSGSFQEQIHGDCTRFHFLGKKKRKKYLKTPLIFIYVYFGGSDGKASAYSAGDLASTPGSGRSSGEGNGNPLQYSCLENPMDRGA